MVKSWYERLYMGTWQFGGQFKTMSNIQVHNLIQLALREGIRQFDTAAVYGNGKVETILGEALPNDCVVLTKIPAKSKSSLTHVNSITEYYDRAWIERQVVGSLLRLRRTKLDIVLLHNWSQSWGSEAVAPLEILSELQREGVIERIGISLPDGFGTEMSNNLISQLDVIEAPYNPLNQWIIPQLSKLRSLGKEIILRSIFLQGMLVASKEQFATFLPSDYRYSRFPSIRQQFGIHEPKTILSDVWKLQTSLTVGMTSAIEIIKNISCLRKE